MNLTQEKTTCYHCGDDCKSIDIEFEEKHFCCQGCLSVYQILNENQLCNFYVYDQNPGQSPVKYQEGYFSFLEQQSVIDKLLSFSSENENKVSFHIPNMHCSSCIYLLEHFYKINSGTIKSEVNFLNRKVHITYNPHKTTLRKIVEDLYKIGYEPLLTLEDLNSDKKQKTSRDIIYKIGISGFCFGNIMMLSFPEYLAASAADVEDGMRYTFNLISLFLALPVFFYSATTFFSSAWQNIKQKNLNIDFPIALAILITFGRSVYEIATQTGPGYLDSMSGIVFFMLVGRFFQNRTYENLSFDRDFQSFFPISVAKKQNNEFINVPISELQKGDKIIIRNEEVIPVDCYLLKGDAQIDYRFVTGEAEPLKKNVGALINAGGRQKGTSIELEVVKSLDQSYLTSLWNDSIFSKEKPSENVFVEFLNRWFSSVVLVLGIGAFIFWMFFDSVKAWNSITTILIVACPCALLLSANFTYGNLLGLLSNSLFYLKNSTVLDNLNQVDTIVFDKTGTLTENKEAEINFIGDNLLDENKILIASLTAHSTHPLSSKIYDSLKNEKIIEIENFSEIAGKGISGNYLGLEIKMGSASFVNLDSKTQQKDPKASQVYVKIGSDILGYFEIKYKYRKNLDEILSELVKTKKLWILSGDKDNERETLEQICPKGTQMLFEQKPDDKLKFIKKLQSEGKNVMMIGDGLNDAGALKQSNVGIAITEDVNNFSPACDGILNAKAFYNLSNFFKIGRLGRNIIQLCFVISLIYNFIGLYFALQGTLSPVIAAILMPSSTFSIIIVSTIASKWAAKPVLS